MAMILVVDDSQSDRLLAGGLLEKRDEWYVSYANDGREAFEVVQGDSPPDLVLTDLNMPELNGLELVEAIKANRPLIPVVLMTAKGSEEIAVEALQKGAASYVSKNALARDLFETIERVLATSDADRSYHRLMNHMTDVAFVLENDLTLISSLVSFLRKTMSDMKLFNESDSLRIGSALDEALTNAYYHGNLEVSSELRAQDHNLYHNLAKQRCTEEPYSHRRIHVQSAVDSNRVQFVIRDEGPGFDPACLPDPTDPEYLERPSGRGVLLMRTFMDEISYNDTGNEVTMIKKLIADEN